MSSRCRRAWRIPLPSPHAPHAVEATRHQVAPFTLMAGSLPPDQPPAGAATWPRPSRSTAPFPLPCNTGCPYTRTYNPRSASGDGGQDASQGSRNSAPRPADRAGRYARVHAHCSRSGSVGHDGPGADRRAAHGDSHSATGRHSRGHPRSHNSGAADPGNQDHSSGRGIFRVRRDSQSSGTHTGNQQATCFCGGEASGVAGPRPKYRDPGHR